MGAFRTNADIGNRVAQHCGQTRLDPVLGLRDGSKVAREVSACYDKVREAELSDHTWTFATRRSTLRAMDANTLLLDPALWVETTTYFIGSIVTDQAGNLWISNIVSNLNNDPLLTAYWEPYFGPLAVPLYAGNSYSAGELVYTTPGDGTYRVYLSVANGNADNPATATAYDATATYFKNQMVTYLSVAYMSLINLNKNNLPSSSPAPWSITTTYALGNIVAGSDGYSYTSLANGNVAKDPSTDNGTNWARGGLVPWTTVFTGGTGSDKWLQIGGHEVPSGVALKQFGPLYPVNAGATTQTSARNVFKLPAGYLKTAPQNPKRTAAWLGGPSGEVYTDWNIENGFLVSADTGPINLRFVADVTDVRRMTAMFCEAFAARVGMAVADSVTQSTSQMGIIAKVYQKFIDDAVTQNAIEAGYDEPPDDDWLTVRY